MFRSVLLRVGCISVPGVFAVVINISTVWLECNQVRLIDKISVIKSSKIFNKHKRLQHNIIVKNNMVHHSSSAKRVSQLSSRGLVYALLNASARYAYIL